MSTGQTLNDRLTAAKHTLAGQGLARIVCKATTEEVNGPKKKHIDNLIHCTNEPNVSIPQLANLLIERTQHNSWVVVFKSLITVHHLMCYGNERFTQYLASSNCTFQLGSFIDKCGVQGYDMSTFIRRYAKYLNEKAIAYRTVAFDFCKCKRGKEDGILRQMNTEKLLKTLPTLQNQLDALLEFDCSSNDLSNGVVSSSFMLLFRDLIRLFACYNDGIINLLEKYFEMNKKHCRDALDIYKKFLIRMDRVAEFLKVAENVGIDKGEIPDLTKLTETCRKLPLFESDDAPSSLLEALEQHLATLEGRKGSTSAASAATSAGENGSPSQEVNGVKVDESVRKAVEEEAEVMSQLKFDNESPLLWEQPAWEDSERRMKDLATGEFISPPGGVTKTNPFLASPAEPAAVQGNQSILDLFSSPMSPSVGGGGKNDLLSLNNNPFADSLFGGGQDQQGQQQDQSPFPSFGTNGFTSATTPSASAFASDASFAAAFGDNTPDFQAASTPTAATPQEITTVKLSLPVMEPFGGRSTSPSPTTDLMRGAGTTPILANPPDGGFGDAVEGTDDTAPTNTANEEPSDFTWGADTAGVKAEQAVITTAASGTDLFGAPFEPPPSTPQPPTAVVPPLSVRANDSAKGDLFGLDSSEFGDFGEQPSSAQPCAPPPSPFGGLDLVGGPDLRAQAMANAGGILPPGMGLQQRTPQGGTGIDNLNFAIQKAMQMPSATLSPTYPQQPMPGAGMAAPGFGSQSFPPMNVCLPPGSTPPASAAFTQLDNFGGSGMAGTPSARASSTPGYGTPPSGLSSPAKSVSGVGAHGSGGFDAFGDTLQPQTPIGKPSSTDKHASSILKGDLDSTLANLACNLDINGPKQAFKKTGGHQWGSPKPAAKTAGGVAPGWAGSAPGGAPPATGAPGGGWSASPQHGFQQPGAPAGGQWGGAFQQQVPATGGMPQQQYMVGGVRPGMTGMGMNMGMSAQQMMPQQGGMFPGYSPQMAVVPPTSAALPSQAAPVNDPFGAL